MVGSQIGISFIPPKNIYSALFFGKPLSESVSTTSYEVTQDVLRLLPILVFHVHVTQECYTCSILAETSLLND